MKGPKLDLQGGPLLISSGSTFWPFFKHVSFAGGSKTGPSTDWIRCLLGGPVLSPPKHLLQLRETHQRHTNQHRVGNKGLEQGRPQLRLQKSYQFEVPKTKPKLALCTCLPWSWQSFPFCFKSCRISKSLQSRRFEAWRGLAEAMPRTQKCSGTRTKRGSRGLETAVYNTIVEVPARLNLK